MLCILSTLRLLSMLPLLWPARFSSSFNVVRRRGAGDSTTELLSTQFRKWSARAIKAFGMAELEARKLKYPTTGSEALLMGMLTEGTSMASRFLRSKGIKLMDLREETVKLLGKADMYYFSPEHPPLTPQAEAALKWAVQEFEKQGSTGEVTPELILLGIWEQKEAGAGHKLLSTLGFTDDFAAELRQLMSS